MRTKLVFGSGREVEVPGHLYGGEITNGLIHHTKKLRLSLWQQHGRDMVRSALWNNCHGDSMVGEGDGDSGDKKTRNGADVVV